MEADMDVVIDVVTHRMKEADIPCIMIGGHAVNHYGVIRATQDVDFMIAATAAEEVRRIMLAAGFTKIAVHESVMFFNKPVSPIRVDFLKVDQDTMKNLLAHAVKAPYAGSDEVLVPRLRDLLAMKLFALATGGPKRRDRDFGDIVNLVIENAFDVEHGLRELANNFADDVVYVELRTRIEELRHA